MTKLESGAIVPNTARHDVGEIVGSALRRAGKILVHHKVSLELAADLPMLELDAVLFEQVLFNLLDNAAKYAPADTTISIRSCARSGFGLAADHGRGRRHSAGRAGERVRQILSRAEGRPCPPRHRPGPCDFARLCRGDAWHDLGRQPRRPQRRRADHPLADPGGRPTRWIPPHECRADQGPGHRRRAADPQIAADGVEHAGLRHPRSLQRQDRAGTAGAGAGADHSRSRPAGYPGP